MPSPDATLSRTLKTITLTKINQLEKQRKAYALRKTAILDSIRAPNVTLHDKVTRLLKGVEELKLPSSSNDADPSNIRRWLEQSQFDSSVPDEMLQNFEVQLRSRLDVETRKLDLASLYSHLLTEWLDPKKPSKEHPSVEEIASLDDSFEVVDEHRLKQLKDKFAAVAFNPLETDVNKIGSLLGSLFSEEGDAKVLHRLRREVKSNGSAALKVQAPFDEDSIQWCLKGLLANELLADDKKIILQEFLKDDVARGEICDVLNMKFKDFENWDWDAGDDGMKVEPRRQLNGKWRVMMDEDVLQAIFLHYIGMMWAVSLKRPLRDCMFNMQAWKSGADVSRESKDERKYFFGDCRVGQEAGGGVAMERRNLYQNDIFLSQLPSSVSDGAGGYDDEETEVNDDWDDWGTKPKRKSPKEIKQRLLRQLATEVQLRKAVDGEVVVVQSDFRWFGTGLPHSTIFAILRFVGMPDEWISFLKKFLEAPLNMGPASSEKGRDGQVKVRKRGTPMAHALEKVLGELVLFFLDLAVLQNGSMLLQRLHDDLWLVGEPSKCANAWRTMEEFAAVMGLELNESKTGSVFLKKGDFTYGDSEVAATLPDGPISIGFLTLNTDSGEWEINQDQVDAHVKQLSKQLATSSSILDWVQTWNSCMGRFFSHTFGEPANCFGKQHVDAILETYKRMQETIFPDSNISKYLKGLIAERFNISDITDAFIFFPEALGGLGVRNPFISPFLVHENVCNSPTERMKQFFNEEKEVYNDAKREFEQLDEAARRRRWRSIYAVEFGNVAPPVWPDDEDLDTFISMEEFTRYRETCSPELLDAYNHLMEAPLKKDVVISRRVKEDLKTLGQVRPELDLSELDGETKWLLQMYERDLFEKFGGLSLVEKDLLPLGILTILRKRRTAWQMVL
jgi:hypothetical protein